MKTPESLLPPLDKENLAHAATIARGLAIDAVQACKSGHLGLPLGAAEIGAVLWGTPLLKYNPENHQWLNRDRFVLSAGHGSMFLYSWLHLSGHDLPLEELRNFRQLGSKTPGHPEFHETPGVESTTGPLGQGVGNAVGMAASAKMAAAVFNTPQHTIIDHHIICLAGDGCLQEGVSSEASAFAAHNGLDNLILIYDSNDVTLDAAGDKSQSEDTAERYEAYGWNVTTLPDGHDLEAIATAIAEAKKNRNGKPSFIVAKTQIGRGMPKVAGTFKAHGEGGVKSDDDVIASRKALGLPEGNFHVSDQVKDYFGKVREQCRQTYAKWEETFKAWREANPEKYALLHSGLHHKVPADLLDKVPTFEPGSKAATRGSGGKVLNAIAKEMPLLISGSADLHGSTKNYINDVGDFSADNFAGRNFYFGIREHAMGAMLNGVAYHGFFRASGATFLAFSDYCRPSIRLAALSGLPVFYIFTHDSVGVGEDGPTHQPVETVSALRCIPNLDVIRPADGEETAAAFVSALQTTHRPTALILSRQDLPDLQDIPVADRRNGTLKGGYIAKKETGELKTIILATGSETHLAMEAAKQLGDGVRVVSMPSMEIFERQDEAYKNEVLAHDQEGLRRIAIEAGVTSLWYRYVGRCGKIIGIDRFGISAPGSTVMKELGITVESIIEAARS